MYYAEFETDKYIREKFFPDFNCTGIIVEVGAGPSEFYSMSKHFRENNWRCICIEPNPNFVEQHRADGNEIYQYACSNTEGKNKFKIVKSEYKDESIVGISFSSLEIKYEMPDLQIEEIEVDVVKLNSLLEKLNIEKIDLLSVDTEGWELEVMQGFDADKYKPSVILIENLNHDLKYLDYMEKIGYSLDSNIEYNYIFYKK